MIIKKRIQKISYTSFLALTCYMLIGRGVQKINLKALNILCSRIKEYYPTDNIIYNFNSLLEFIKTYRNVENYKHIHLFFFVNDEIIFKDDVCQVLTDLSKLFANIKQDKFEKLYQHINSFINMYQLIDVIE